MKRLERIEKLEQIQYNIETTAKHIVNLVNNNETYYKQFGKLGKMDSDIEIQQKCLEYWKRRFNRELLKLGYKL